MANRSQTASRIVIVGGGISGLAIAVRLAQVGLPVTVLETAQLGFEASTRNQGWLYSGGWFAVDRPDLARMCYDSLQKTLQFCPDCVEPAHEGMAYLISRPDTPSFRWTDAWTAAGIPWRELPRSELFEHVRGLADSEVRRAFLLPDRAIRPDVLLERLAATAQNAGVEVRTSTPVARLEFVRDRIEGVATGPGEVITARTVILAANTESLGLLPDKRDGELASVRQVTHTPVAVKMHLMAVRPEVSRWPFCVVDGEGFNHIPHRETSVFGTSRWLPVADPADQRPVTAEFDRLWELLYRFLPGMRSSQPEVTTWVGTTVEAMQSDQVEPGRAPLPAVVDHEQEPPRVGGLLSVYPGRATLWPQLVEKAREVVLKKLDARTSTVSKPPWAV